jgi:cytosine/adenosine deaminase-related metal-dependent hydrolase
MMLLRARAVVPVFQPPMADGAVCVAGRRVRGVEPWRDASRRFGGRVVDLGEVVLLPGLVNAHCHLDYTGMAGQIPPPKSFTEWLKTITATKAGWGYSDYAASWLQGAQMLLRTGTTTVADIEAVPELLPEVRHSTPLRVLSFLEMIGITPRRPPSAVLGEAIKTLEALEVRRECIGLSPHAPYSTVPELLCLSAETARRRHWRLAIHLAESALEFEMFTHGRGTMYEWLQRSGREMSDCGTGSPVRHLERFGVLSPRLLAAHVNYLAPGDARLLAKRGVHVVHCPRSHAYFRHDPFPYRRLARAGVNICLGTDSLVTVDKPRRQTVELDMFAEMRALAANDPSLPARTILQLATVNGANAMGFKGRIGELARGAYADLIALPFTGKMKDIYEAILQHQGAVAASMAGGRWALAPGHSSQVPAFGSL